MTRNSFGKLFFFMSNLELSENVLPPDFIHQLLSKVVPEYEKDYRVSQESEEYLKHLSILFLNNISRQAIDIAEMNGKNTIDANDVLFINQLNSSNFDSIPSQQNVMPSKDHQARLKLIESFSHEK